MLLAGFGVCRVQRDSNLAGAASEFVAALQIIVKLPRDQCAPTNRFIFFVLRNRAQLHENFHEALVCEHTCVVVVVVVVGIRIVGTRKLSCIAWC